MDPEQSPRKCPTIRLHPRIVALLRGFRGKRRCGEFLDARLRKAVARSALLEAGVPCWPGQESGEGGPELILHGGRRVMLVGWPRCDARLDDMLRRKCDYLLCVQLTGPGEGRVRGALTWFDYLPLSIGLPVRLDRAPLRHLEYLKNRVPPFRSLGWCVLRGWLSLVVRGRPAVPPPLDPG
ncbi:hypothetical protein GF402_11655 [Candidatus Fermentibacteria bacterium]|nr:hypothetical protein [Candidatus Fermentibacteria bacterium]